MPSPFDIVLYYLFQWVEKIKAPIFSFMAKITYPFRRFKKLFFPVKTKYNDWLKRRRDEELNDLFKYNKKLEDKQK